ncbi:hypothetical protein ACFFRR_010067 [Megaselia abdita]
MGRNAFAGWVTGAVRSYENGHRIYSRNNRGFCENEDMRTVGKQNKSKPKSSPKGPKIYDCNEFGHFKQKYVNRNDKKNNSDSKKRDIRARLRQEHVKSRNENIRNH